MTRLRVIPASAWLLPRVPNVRSTILLALVVVSAPPAFAAPDAQGCSYLVSPQSVTVAASGGTGQITVTTASHCSWSARTGSGWISMSPTAGVGSGSITWVAAPSTLRTQRFGWLDIAGRTVWVAQQVAPSTTAPGAPRQLTASVTGSTVTFAWSAPDSGGAPSAYVLAAGSASGLSNLASFSTGNTLTTFSATNVPNGSYFVRISAQNASGTGPASNEVNFAVGQQSCSAAPPTALQGAVSGSLVTLTWTAPADGGVTSYVVEAGSAPALSNLAIVNTGSPATTFAANAPSGTYFVRVRAATACGISPPTIDVPIVVP